MGNMQEVSRFRSISEFHRFRNLSRPEHPLISIIDVSTVKYLHPNEPKNLVFDFYSISLKRSFNARVKYGQQDYDFDDGIMNFMSPGQVFSISLARDEELTPSGWLLLIHPDFLWGSTLAKTIKHYDFFDYAVSEALFVSEKEEAIISDTLQNMRQEYGFNIDKFSQGIIVAHLEVLLKYAERFYQRQFITRKISNHQILTRLEDLLDVYFSGSAIKTSGLPTVGYVADELNVSAGYLASVLRSLTGLNTQQHIHMKLIDEAKVKLSTTNLSVSEVAYALGFEHIQSFSKLFKQKTKLSPLEFRASFN